MQKLVDILMAAICREATAPGAKRPGAKLLRQ